MKKSIILIGMPGAGKSTVGVILAKAAGLAFCDTDLIIQESEGELLQTIIDLKGDEYFKTCEEKHILTHRFEQMVVATGGSVVYSEKAMKHLKQFGSIVYLDVSVSELERRIGDFACRGVVGNGSVADIFAQRGDLYQKYADVIIDCNDKNTELVAAETLKMIGL